MTKKMMIIYLDEPVHDGLGVELLVDGGGLAAGVAPVAVSVPRQPPALQRLLPRPLQGGQAAALGQAGPGHRVGARAAQQPAEPGRLGPDQAPNL